MPMSDRMKKVLVLAGVLVVILVIVLVRAGRSGRFNSSDPDRGRALREIAGGRNPKAARDAALASLDHDDPDVRSTALVMLGRKGDAADIPLVQRAAADADPRVRGVVSSALVRFGTHEAIETVCDLAINDESEHVRHAAFRALAGTDDPIARVTVVTALDYATDDTDRQAAADSVIENLGMRLSPDVSDPVGWAQFVESVKRAEAVREAYAELDVPLVDDPALWEEMKGKHARLCHAGAPRPERPDHSDDNDPEQED
jgi:HEAT repeat protein